jgi:hypothetical protein
MKEYFMYNLTHSIPHSILGFILPVIIENAFGKMHL